MARATNFDEFDAVLQRLQVPYFHVISTGRDGRIQLLFNGQVPVRPELGVDWSGPIPGDSSEALWSGNHNYADLPKVTDPVSGWVQNSNSPPWYAANPLALDPTDFPTYMAPQFLHWRERRGIRVLEENPALTLDGMLDLQRSSRMELADHVLDDLIVAARAQGTPVAAAAADVLAAWDRQAIATSTGTLLFTQWVGALGSADPELLSDIFAKAWDPKEPLTMPSGLADPARAVTALERAAGYVESLFGRLDVPWGEVARMKRGAVDVPANGVVGEPFGSLRVIDFESSTLETEKKIYANFGDTYVAGVEFGETVRAKVLMTYGNSSQPTSPHFGDQLALSSAGQMRDAWLTRAEIEANLEEREVIK
jgi:acyl-homoserine-lactone acylase